MKMNYPVRFTITILAIVLSGLSWYSFGVARGLDLKGGASLTYQLDMKGVPQDQRSPTLLNTVSVIEERINRLGLKDVKIDALPPDQFEVQFPGQEARDVEHIKNILTRLGQLEFRMIAMPANALRIGEPGKETSERERRKRMGDAYKGPPIGYRWVPQHYERDKKGKLILDKEGKPVPAGPDRLVEIPEAQAKRDVKRLEKAAAAVAKDPKKLAEADRQLAKAKEKLANVEKKDVFTGSDLDTGALGIGIDTQGAGWVVHFAMKDTRKVDFADFTGHNIKRQMAIIIDGRIDSAPTIQSRLSGQSQITGGGYGFKKQEAQDLVTVLRSGSLNVGIKLQSEYAIGPSLGEAAIRRGFLATAIGFLAVVVFMIVTYYFAGFVAVLALLMNLLMIMGLLAFLQAELSLPGIAGVILTVGMAVDANILVFERIREEREAGKSLVQAVKAGYDRAFITIVDANVTTVFVAVVLYVMTTGQVRGFAATLAFGIISSMFTALYVTRTIFGWLIDKGFMTKMAMPKLLAKVNLSYMKIRLPTIGTSLTLIVLGFIAFQNLDRHEKYDIEFLSGERVVMDLKKPLGIKVVKNRILGTYPDAAVVSIKSEHATKEALNLSLESDAFQVTIGNVNTDEERQKVLAFFRKEFGKELVPDGLVEVKDKKLSEGTKRLRLTFEKPISKSEMMAILTQTKGASKPKIESLSGKTAVVDVTPTVPADVFHEDLNRSLDKVHRSLTEPFPMKSFVDPKTAEQHRDDAIQAVIVSLIFQILYIYFRFHGASFGFAAVIALIHDVMITLGAIAFCTHFNLVNVRISLPIIAAILTLIGYSMNDTIVVFDRIRENLGRTKKTLSEIIDLSVNQTLSRTLRTSGTTIVVVIVLFIMNYGQASSVLEGFSFVLIVGIITGTYSSIFIASPMLLFLPWHYIRGQRAHLFWWFVGTSIFGILFMLFATGTAADVAGWVMIAAYPAYFFFDFFRWLSLKDPDRALNMVLRSQVA